MRKLVLALFLLLLALIVGVPVVMVGIGPRPIPPLTPVEITVHLFRHDTGEIVSIPLEEYVKGVVAAEMPAEFEPEALKAQAVLARTYAVRRLRAFGGPGLEEEPRADISSDPARGQAWLDQTGLRKKWGLLAYYRYWSKVSRAVEETRGLVLTYKGELAEGLYHSTCGGHTESAQEVWGKDLPYLRGVPCDFCRDSPHYRTTVQIPLAQVAERIGTGGAVTAMAAGSQGIGVVQTTATGRVKMARLGPITLKGPDFRARLGLPSTWVNLRVEGDRLRVDACGWGHGVGMCQYGARGMARQGRNYIEILGYYFPGTDVKAIFSE